MKTEFRFRPGTMDEAIYDTVVLSNEYNLPETLPLDGVIIDIGVHIGSYCHAVLSRGARVVHGFEADRANFESARANLAGYGRRVRLQNKAVWRSDRPVKQLYFTDCPEPSNTGWREVFGDAGVAVPAVAFDDVILDITDGGRRRVHLLKIDCEGSEFPILLTSHQLHRIDMIVGEFHEFGPGTGRETIPEHARIDGDPPFTLDTLCNHLRTAGFQVEAHRAYENCPLGHFRAIRTSIPAPKSLQLLFRRWWQGQSWLKGHGASSSLA